jgi:hypothetical protein
VVATCACGNEPSGSIKRGNFLTSCKPVSFSKDSTPWSNYVSIIISSSASSYEVTTFVWFRM